jgi:hypothetical protein
MQLTLLISAAVHCAGEDVHAGIARRYGVPMMSVRDTLHDLMWNDAGMKGSSAALQELHRKMISPVNSYTVLNLSRFGHEQLAQHASWRCHALQGRCPAISLLFASPTC